MNDALLEDTIRMIVESSLVYARKYIPMQLGPIDYVGIFSENESRRKEYIRILERQHSRSVYTDNDGELYQLRPCVTGIFGKICLVKICYVPSKYNYSGHKIGYTDFQCDSYSELKKKYEHASGFTMMHGDGWEILCLEDPKSDVSVYIPNIPLSRDLGITVT